jgi:hypothetical protein
MRPINLKSIYLILTTIIIAIIIGVSAQTETAVAENEICDRWYPEYETCFGMPVNCFCPIIIEEG